MCVCMFRYRHRHTHTHTHIYTHTYIYIYMHTHTHIYISQSAPPAAWRSGSRRSWPGSVKIDNTHIIIYIYI